VEFPYTRLITSENETAELAGEFIRDIAAGSIVILNGNLGAGKTFFIKKALETLGIRNVNSPTFAIVNEYYNNSKIYHFDFYRINNIRELFDIGFNDYMNDTDSITFIEWGELFKEILPRERIEIKITLNEDLTRKFEFEKYG